MADLIKQFKSFDRHSDMSKLRQAKAIAEENNCFIVERGGYDNKEYILYRRVDFAPNQRIGMRRTVAALLTMVNKACVTE